MDHQRPTPSTDEPAEVPARAPTHAERCRTLAAAARSATLCTIGRVPAGFPYGSLVTVAFDTRGRPLLFLSELAEHTGNLHARSEASLLVSERLDEGGEPLALGRMTLLGHVRRVPDAERADVRELFLAQQPSASFYVEMKDFAFYRQEIQAIRYVGGFGRMSWVEADAYMAAEPDPLAASSAGILAHMNEDHQDAMMAYVRAFAKIEGATRATMTAVDRYGFEMRVIVGEKPRVVRLAFEQEVKTTGDVRTAMVAMVKTARGILTAS
jgi:putative heme iron utilization protein